MTSFAQVPLPPAAAGAPNVGKPVAARMPPPQGAPIVDPARPFPGPPQAEGGPAMGKPGGQPLNPATGDVSSPGPGQQTNADPRFFDLIRTRLANAVTGRQSGAGVPAGAAPPQAPPWGGLREDPRMAMLLQRAHAAQGAARQLDPRTAQAMGGARQLDPRAAAMAERLSARQGVGDGTQLAQRYAALAEAQRDDPRIVQAMGARQAPLRDIQDIMAQRAPSLQGGADPKRQPLELPRPVAGGAAAPPKQVPGKPRPPWVR